jgi:hypothetical protein
VQCIDLFLQIRGEDLEQQDPYVKLWESMNHVIAAIDLAPANGAIWVKVTPTHSPTHPPTHPLSFYSHAEDHSLSIAHTLFLPPYLTHLRASTFLSLFVPFISLFLPRIIRAFLM